MLEDDHDLGGMYASQLRQDGHTVIMLDDAQDALDYLHRKPVDVVILDLMLPIHNGFAFLYEMRGYEDWHDVPVMILSNLQKRDFPVSEQLLRHLGVRDILCKSRVRPADVVASAARLQYARRR